MKPREMIAVLTAAASLAAAVNQAMQASSSSETTRHTDASLRACLMTLESVLER